jgi:hypothetical protein
MYYDTMAKHFYALHYAERPHTVPSTPNLDVWYAVKYLLPKLQHFGFGPVNITRTVLRECIFSLDEVFKKDGRAIKCEIFGFGFLTQCRQELRPRSFVDADGHAFPVHGFTYELEVLGSETPAMCEDRDTDTQSSYFIDAPQGKLPNDFKCLRVSLQVQTE